MTNQYAFLGNQIGSIHQLSPPIAEYFHGTAALGPSKFTAWWTWGLQCELVIGGGDENILPQLATQVCAHKFIFIVCVRVFVHSCICLCKCKCQQSCTPSDMANIGTCGTHPSPRIAIPIAPFCEKSKSAQRRAGPASLPRHFAMEQSMVERYSCD